MKTDSDKINKINCWAIPKNPKELKSFLGLCGYYRKFIKNYASIVAPLETLCNKQQLTNNNRNEKKMNDQFIWTEVHDTAMAHLKTCLTTAPILAYPTRFGPYILDTDASHDSIGAVLSQVQNGEEKVIAYASRRLTKSERSYCITRKELLSIYYFTKYFKHYIFGRQFLIRTDHKALIWMLNWRKPNTSQYCLWKAELELYDMVVEHRPGEKHGNADALSRLPSCEQCEIKHEEPKKKRNVKHLDDNKSITIKYPVVMHVEDHNDDDIDIPLITTLMKNERLNENTPAETDVATNQTKSLWKRRNELRIRGELLYLLENGCYRLIVKQCDRKVLINKLHTQLAHSGIYKMYCHMKQSFYWPNMKTDIKEQLSECTHCIFHKTKFSRDRAPLQPYIASRPFERIGIDVTGPFEKTPRNNVYILGVIDYFSKYVCLIPIKRTDSSTVAQALWEKWISVFGVPEVIHSDRGTNFESEIFLDLCRILGIRKTHTCPFYPQSDGLIERLFKTAKEMIGAMRDARTCWWDEVIPSVEMALRGTIQQTTGFSPFEALFGVTMKFPYVWENRKADSVQPRTYTNTIINQLKLQLQQVRKQIQNNIKRNTEKQRYYYDRNRMANIIQVNDHVAIKIYNRIKRRFDPHFRGPFRVLRKIGEWTYELLDERTGKVINRNYNQVRPMPKVEEKSQHHSSKGSKTSIVSRSCGITTMIPSKIARRTPATVRQTGILSTPASAVQASPLSSVQSAPSTAAQCTQSAAVQATPSTVFHCTPSETVQCSPCRRPKRMTSRPHRLGFDL